MSWVFIPYLEKKWRKKCFQILFNELINHLFILCTHRYISKEFWSSSENSFFFSINDDEKIQQRLSYDVLRKRFLQDLFWFSLIFPDLFFSGMTGHRCNEQIQEMQVGVRFVCASVLATNGRVDGREVILEGSSWGKHLVFIRHRGQEQASRWRWSLYTIEKSLIPPTSAPQMCTSTHRACLMYSLNINHVLFHNLDI